MEEVESESDKLIPFNVCFIEKHLLGRSNIKIGKPMGLAPIIAEKFYTNTTKQDEENQDTIKKYFRKLIELGPREKYSKPITENHKYGWYNHIKFVEVNGKLNFHKNTNILVHEHLMNYAKIRE